METRTSTADRKLANLALLALFGSALGTTPASLAAAEEKYVSVESRPVESNGVALVISATKNIFENDEPISLRITFRNTTPDPVWLPPNQWGYGILRLEDTSTGKNFTGVSAYPRADMGLPFPPPIRLQPYGSHSYVVTSRNLGFVEGVQGYDDAGNKLFESLMKLRPEERGGAKFPPPPGSYRLTVEVRSLANYRDALEITLANASSCKKQTADFLARNEEDDDFEFNNRQCRINDLPDDFDLKAFWNEDVIRSAPVELRVAAPKI